LNSASLAIEQTLVLTYLMAIRDHHTTMKRAA